MAMSSDAQRARQARYRERNRAGLASKARTSRAVSKQFVAIDSEGVSFGALATMPDGAQAQCQRTVFWGASTAEGDPVWLDGAPYCGTVDIIEFLLSLPERFGPSIFVWFGSSYDATQIFADLPYQKAWELQFQKPFGEPHEKRRAGRYVFWKDYALSYIKQKCLTICQLKDPENPRDAKGTLRFARRISIFDTFGFFQTSFLKAARSIPGSMSAQDEEIIKAGKMQRGDFALNNRTEMQHYTAAELRVLARMMEALRTTLEGMDLRLSRWQGAGSIASALLTQRGAKAHYASITSADIRIEQEWAHHAFFGGRIECLKQGTHDGVLWSYDVRSAYPFHMSLLPSMANGSFEFRQDVTTNDVRAANVLSMFQVEFRCEVSADPGLLNRYGGKPGPCFYPLPYRDTGGRILFPPHVRGIYMAEEVCACLDWILAHRQTHPALQISFSVEAGLIFRTGCNELPFAWIPEMYDERRAIIERAGVTGIYDLTEKTIKLGINSVYGKTAQSVGNSDTPPSTACPWYAAAITAGTRAQLCRAALTVGGDAIVAFQTDGIISKRRIAVAEGVTLGAWECEELRGRSVFVQPGIYALPKKAKHRGIKPDLLGTDDFTSWLTSNVVEAWARGDTSATYPYRQYLTLGASVASEGRFKHAGWWVDGTRELKFNNLGHKRAAPVLPSQRRARARQLIDTVPKPAFYHVGAAPVPLPLSEPHRPDWIDTGYALESETATLNEEIACTNGGMSWVFGTQ